MEPISQFATTPGSRILFEVDGVTANAVARGLAAAEQFLSNAQLTPFAAFSAVAILDREWHDAKEDPEGLQHPDYWSQLRRRGLLWNAAEDVALQVATAGLPDQEYQYSFCFTADQYIPTSTELAKIPHFKGRPNMHPHIWAAVN